MDWHTNFMPINKELDPNECKNIIYLPKRTDNAELNQFSYESFFTKIDEGTFQVEIEKKKAPLVLTKPNSVHAGVCVYQLKK